MKLTEVRERLIGVPIADLMLKARRTDVESTGEVESVIKVGQDFIVYSSSIDDDELGYRVSKKEMEMILSFNADLNSTEDILNKRVSDFKESSSKREEDISQEAEELTESEYKDKLKDLTQSMNKDLDEISEEERIKDEYSAENINIWYKNQEDAKRYIENKLNKKELLKSAIRAAWSKAYNYRKELDLSGYNRLDSHLREYYLEVYAEEIYLMSLLTDMDIGKHIPINDSEACEVQDELIEGVTEALDELSIREEDIKMSKWIKPGKTYMFSKSGSGHFQSIVIEANDGSHLIDMSFDSITEAEKFAEKHNIPLVSYADKTIDEKPILWLTVDDYDNLYNLFPDDWSKANEQWGRLTEKQKEGFTNYLSEGDAANEHMAESWLEFVNAESEEDFWENATNWDEVETSKPKRRYMQKGNTVKVTHSSEKKLLNKTGVITKEDTPQPGFVEVEIDGKKRTFNVSSLFDMSLEVSAGRRRH
jgi:hypothetical protein